MKLFNAIPGDIRLPFREHGTLLKHMFKGRMEGMISNVIEQDVTERLHRIASTLNDVSVKSVIRKHFTFEIPGCGTVSVAVSMSPTIMEMIVKCSPAAVLLLRRHQNKIEKKLNHDAPLPVRIKMEKNRNDFKGKR